MAGRLTNLDVHETSGVDHPAHLVEGWMLMKSKNPGLAGRVSELLKAATNECPDCGASVAKSAGHCPECGATMPNVEKSGSLQRVQALGQALEALISEGGEMGEETVVEKTEEVTSTASEDEMLKEVPEAVRALIAKEREAREELEKALDSEKARRETDEAVAKAASWAHLGIEKSEFGATLQKLRRLDPDIAEAIEKVLDGAEKVGEASALFDTIGKSVAGGGTEGEGQLEAMAKAMQAEDPELSYPEAYSKALDTEAGQRAYAEVSKMKAKE